MDTRFLYHVSRTDDWGMDEYSEFVVCASSLDEAKYTHPAAGYTFSEGGWKQIDSHSGQEFISKYHSWVETSKIDTLEVKLIGTAEHSVDKGIVCASYHAG